MLRVAAVLSALVLAACGSSRPAVQSESESPRIVQPGAPGQAARVVQPGAPGQESRIASDSDILTSKPLPHTEADVAFMQGMIGHHAQALDMTALIADRTNRRDLILLGKRIEISQKSEIELMERWLQERGEDVPEATAHHMMSGHVPAMPGMLSPEQMKQLEKASGDEFYRLWLEFMIQHHQGAITMVGELLATPGAAQGTEIYRFADAVEEDQSMEIRRMAAMLAGMP